MRIAILYICTWKYKIFWDTFFQSSEKYLLPAYEKHYFVFTDAENISSSEKITKIFRTGKGFPLDSLLRFEMFLQIKEELRKSDYIYFFNSNMQFVSEVGDEILPDISHQGIVGLLHPGYYKKHFFWYPYERRTRSTAYMYPNCAKYRYFMGALIGGRTDEYLALIEECNNNIQTDLENDIIAIYHDESHLNHALAEKVVLELSPAYGYPEGYNLPFDKKIIILDKVKHGGDYFDKLPKVAYYRRMKLFLYRLISGIYWYSRRCI